MKVTFNNAKDFFKDNFDERYPNIMLFYELMWENACNLNDFQVNCTNEILLYDKFAYSLVYLVQNFQNILETGHDCITTVVDLDNIPSRRFFNEDNTEYLGHLTSLEFYPFMMSDVLKNIFEDKKSMAFYFMYSLFYQDDGNYFVYNPLLQDPKNIDKRYNIYSNKAIFNSKEELICYATHSYPYCLCHTDYKVITGLEYIADIMEA